MRWKRFETIFSVNLLVKEKERLIRFDRVLKGIVY